jgi:hypothetical protein
MDSRHSGIVRADDGGGTKVDTLYPMNDIIKTPDNRSGSEATIV